MSRHYMYQYKNSPVSSDAKWPPTPSRQFINLAVVEGGHRCRDEYIGHTLLGNITDILEKRKEISIEQILEAEDGQNKLRLVLVEGAPGIGKSTLAWELCRKWEEFSCMQQYSLVVLLRLREEEVQKIAKVSQLFYSYESEDKETSVKEVSDGQGRGILFILDGFDELPKPLQQKGFLLNLIKGSVLPESTVLVTSRPSATAELLTSCRPQIQKHVEVLGFTQESVEAYASSIFSTQPGTLEKFKAYISSSNNPAINSLMYVPLNAAIIVEIYRDCKSENLLPHTLTELYTQLCLTILNRYLKIHHPSVTAEKFEDLPSDLYQQFLHLSEVAFEGVKNEEVIFRTVPSTHFGFLDAVSALYGGGRVSYNFLHQTVQEFFTAYHISHLGSSGLEVFQRYGKVQRWNVVWRFVAGFTKFREYAGCIDRSMFIEVKDELQFSLFLFQCLLEAQTMEHFSSTLKSSSTTAFVEAIHPTSLDAYALGFCIANFPIGVSWEVSIEGVGHHSFTCGLQTNIPSVGVITGLHVRSCPFDFQNLKSNPLLGITTLGLTNCKLTNMNMVQLSDLFKQQKLSSLNTLIITNNRVSDGEKDGLLKVLHHLYHSNVITLGIGNTGLGELFNSSHDYSSAIKRLIDPSSGKLAHLGIGSAVDSTVDEKLVGLLSAPSSLTSLSIFSTNLSSHVEYLNNNTQLVYLLLTNLDLSSQSDIQGLVDIVTHTKTLQELILYTRFTKQNIDAVGPLFSAIHKNGTLQKIDLRTRRVRDSDKEALRKSLDARKDSRISWNFYE